MNYSISPLEHVSVSRLEINNLPKLVENLKSMEDSRMGALKLFENYCEEEIEEIWEDVDFISINMLITPLDYKVLDMENKGFRKASSRKFSLAQIESVLKVLSILI